MGMLPQDIGVIIPAYNEAANLVTLGLLKSAYYKRYSCCRRWLMDETGDIAVKEGVNLLFWIKIKEKAMRCRWEETFKQ